MADERHPCFAPKIVPLIGTPAMGHDVIAALG
jgi:hypothetical protein